jgi:hypothetical protein
MSYPTDGKLFEAGGKIYKWVPYSPNYNDPYGQTGRFKVRVWTGKYFKWKKAYCLTPGQEWKYV